MRRSTKQKTSKASKTKKKQTASSAVKLQTAVASVRATSASVRSHATEVVCGLNDPFCEHARGARYMDVGHVRSLAVPFHSRTTISTDGSGKGATLFLPNYVNDPFVPAASWTGSTYSPGYFTARGNLPCFASRLVTMGLVLRNTAAPMYASGIVRIRVFAVPNGSGFFYLNPESYNCADYFDIPLQDLKEFAVRFNRTDETSKLFKISTTYAAAGASAIDWVSPAFTAVSVSIHGGPASTSPIDVEIFENWECTFSDSDGMAQLALPPIPKSPLLDQATDLVSSKAKSLFKEGMKSAGKWILDSASKALSTAFSVRFPAAGAALGMIKDVD